MKLKLSPIQLLMVLMLFGVSTIGHAQKSISKVSSNLLTVGAIPSIQSKAAPNARIAGKQNLTALDHLQIFDGHVVIEAIAKADPSSLLTELEALGLQKGSYFGGMVSGLFPIDKIAELDAVNALRYIRPAYKPMTNTGSVTGQGDVAQLSDVGRTSFGVDGSGFRVGVISDSWDNLGGQASGISSGDLPADIVILEDLPGGGSDEGRAMGELVFDVAPGASLAFHTAFLGQADFANGILELAAAGSDVIVDDIIYFAEPMFQDGIIGQAADMVSRDGVPYFSSAGNQLDESYESPFNNGGTFELTDFFSGATIGEYELHDFDPGEGVDCFQELEFGSTGGTIILSFQWDEPFASVCAGCPGSESDLDVFLALVDGDVTSIFTALSGMDFNIGGDAVERIGVNGTGKAYLVIGKWLGPAGFPIDPNPDPGLIKYVNFGSVSITEYATQSSTSYGHANAKRAVSVGAVRYDATPEYGENPPLREVFSSLGGVPTLFDTKGKPFKKPKVRRKPEISAVQGTNNTFFGFDYEGDGYPNFFGTSASAPHTAGVAALMLEATDGKIKPDKITKAMQKSALDMDDPSTPKFDKGFDFATGAGFLQADAAIAAAIETSGVYRFVLIDPITDTPIRTLRDGEIIELTPAENGVFNIEALVSKDGKNVKHVKFKLTSDDDEFKKYTKSDRKAPFALFGDKKGNYSPGTLPVGNYNLIAEAAGHKRQKEKLSNTIAFSIVGPIKKAAANTRIAGELNQESSERSGHLSGQLLNVSELVVYPNPSDGIVNFRWNADLEGKVVLSIFDSMGRIVKVFESNSAFEHSIDFSNFRSDVYFARIITSKYTEVKRFIIK